MKKKDGNEFLPGLDYHARLMEAMSLNTAPSGECPPTLAQMYAARKEFYGRLAKAMAKATKPPASRREDTPKPKEMKKIAAAAVIAAILGTVWQVWTIALTVYLTTLALR